MGMLIIGEAFMGWYMVASGLVDRPSVSHFDLTAHLLLALSLLGLSLWTALGHKYGFPNPTVKTKWSQASKLAFGFLGVLLIQISYGGFTAGLKAGHVSDTWPLMFGKLIPPNLFSSFINVLENPATIVFIHRWFAFVVLVAVIYLYTVVRKYNYQPDLLNGFGWFIGAVSLQIILGILTILSYVNIVVALLHQAGAIALFALTIYFIHRFRAIDAASPVEMSIPESLKSEM